VHYDGLSFLLHILIILCVGLYLNDFAIVCNSTSISYHRTKCGFILIWFFWFYLNYELKFGVYLGPYVFQPPCGIYIAGMCQCRDGRRHALKIIRNVNKYREAAKLEINVLQRLHDSDSHQDKSVPFINFNFAIFNFI